MKLKEAKKIVSTIIQWQMVLIGIVERQNLKIDKDFKKYTLQQLIDANSLLKNHDEKNAKKARQKGVGIKSHMLVDDRLIAAVYVSLHYEPSENIHTVFNDVGVGCINVEY